MLDFQKKKQLGILVQIAMVDEDFSDIEKDAIVKIGTKYGATPEELEEVMSNPDITESLKPMGVVEKMDFMMDCILVIVADDVVSSAERYFALQMAHKLAFSPEIVELLIENKDKSSDEMRELMLGYLK